MLRYVACALSALLGIFFLLRPASVRDLAGFRPLQKPGVEELDAVGTADDRQAPRFLADRNKVRLVVPSDMRVGRLLALYQISYDHVRNQIAGQLGKDSITDDEVLRAGQELTLELTPYEEAR